jgi:Transcriptional regulators
MATLYDVAKKAGVSKTLVSRVIGGKKGVSEQSRAKIEAAMEELQYTPNALARSLVLMKTNTIGVVMDSLCEPYFFDLIKGIEYEVANTEYNVIFCSGQGRLNVKSQYIDYMTQGRVDGIVIFGSRLDDEALIEQLSKSKFPAVVIENDLKEMNINNIVIDNEYGSKLAVSHLVSCGCRKIFHLVGDERIKVAIDRKRGYKKAMKSHGIEVDDSMLLLGGFEIDSGYQAVSKWLSANGTADLPDAIYCGADRSAIGAMFALEDAGVRIPEQVMIVGFDDEKPSGVERTYKNLTTISQPFYQIGISAVQTLINEIDKKWTEKQRIEFLPKLIVRDTTIVN